MTFHYMGTNLAGEHLVKGVDASGEQWWSFDPIGCLWWTGMTKMSRDFPAGIDEVPAAVRSAVAAWLGHPAEGVK